MRHKEIKGHKDVLCNKLEVQNGQMDVDNLHQMWKGRPLENSIREEGTNQRKVQDRQTDGGRLNEKQAIKTCLLVFRPISGS